MGGEVQARARSISSSAQASARSWGTSSQRRRPLYDDDDKLGTGMVIEHAPGLGGSLPRRFASPVLKGAMPSVTASAAVAIPSPLWARHRSTALSSTG